MNRIIRARPAGPAGWPSPGRCSGRGETGVRPLLGIERYPLNSRHGARSASDRGRPSPAGQKRWRSNRGQRLEKRQQARPPQSLPRNCRSVTINAVQLKDRLCDIQPDNTNRRHGTSPPLGRADQIGLHLWVESSPRHAMGSFGRRYGKPRHSSRGRKWPGAPVCSLLRPH
jgi:hypothetical protein